MDALLDAACRRCRNPAAEPVLALQRELQEEALGAITNHTQGVTELYFVAFAPDGDGATWRPRIEQAKRVMDERWATEGRSLAYVNDTSLLTQAPMATVTHGGRWRRSAARSIPTKTS